MSSNLDTSNDTDELMTHVELIYLPNHDQQSDADGRMFYSGEFVTTKANKNRSWRWKLLRSGESLYRLCVEPLSDRAITLSSVALYGDNYTDPLVLLTEKKNIGQPRYQSGDFSVANCMPGFHEDFTHGYGIDLELVLKWTDEEVKATPIPLSPASVLKLQYNKVMNCADSAFELVSSDGQSFYVSVTILEAKSAYFKRFFATEGWKEQMDGRMDLVWTSGVVRQLIRYVYLNDVDGDVCELLPDILDAAQMWELIGMKAVIEAQMKGRLQKAARDTDTDMAAEYLKMAHLHSMASLVPTCSGILADNFDQFYASDICKQMEQNETYRQLVKDVIDRLRK